MKIRKLIFSAKLEQIEKQNQNIFIFHCSANAAQWRLLKNYLYNKSQLQPNVKSSLSDDNQQPKQCRESGKMKPTPLTSLGNGTEGSSSYSFRAFFQSTSLKKTNCTDSNERYANLFNTVSLAKSVHKKFKPKGCLFFFDTQSDNILETHEKNSICLKLVNKMESLEFNNSLIMLYGQMKSTVVNHIDVKDALILDTRATYEQFFLSMQSPSIGLSYCLHQKLDEFFCIQERIKSKLADSESN